MIENDMVRKVDILEMDPDERVVALGGIIGEAEELRTGAPLGGGQFDDDRYNLALEYAVTVAGQYQTRSSFSRKISKNGF